jgi:hypothetical protein
VKTVRVYPRARPCARIPVEQLPFYKRIQSGNDPGRLAQEIGPFEKGLKKERVQGAAWRKMVPYSLKKCMAFFPNNFVLGFVQNRRTGTINKCNIEIPVHL